MDQESEEKGTLAKTPLEASTVLPVALTKAAIIYPYREGVSGIPFDRIFTRTQEYAKAQKSDWFEATGEVRSGSGRKINYTVSKDWSSIAVRDKDYPYFLLGAEVVDFEGRNALKFTLYTKPDPKNAGKYNFLNNGGRHPDFKAGKFVEFALAYFKAKGIPIDLFEAYWGHGGTNWEMFMEAYRKEEETALQSAERTWTFTKLRSLGFTGRGRVTIGRGSVTAFLERH